MNLIYPVYIGMSTDKMIKSDYINLELMNQNIIDLVIDIPMNTKYLQFNKHMIGQREIGRELAAMGLGQALNLGDEWEWVV